MNYYNDRHYGQAFGFDDIMLVPQKSDVPSRESVDLSTGLTPKHTLHHPIVSSNMATVTELSMLKAMVTSGSTGFLHRFMSYENMKNIMLDFYQWRNPAENHLPFVLSLGVKEEDRQFVKSFTWGDLFPDIVLIDIAHGHANSVIDMIKFIREYFPSKIIAGNVATPEGFVELAKAGADAVRVGISGGAACTTRSVTGHGMPTLYSVALCNEARYRYCLDEVKIIADGGIRTSADAVKCLAFGADTVCIGTILAGTSESPGLLMEVDGKKVKEHYGMSSKVAQDRHKGGLRRGIAAEGIDVLVPYKGDTVEFINNFVGGIKSGLAYSGAYNLPEFRENFQYTTLSPGTINHNQTNWGQ